MSQISCVIYRSNFYNLFVCQKSEINLFKYASTKYNLTKTMFVYLSLSETLYTIYRTDLHNSQASRKKLKKQLIVKNKLSINVKTKNISKYD